MKYFFTTILVFFSFSILNAQEAPPEFINYSSVIRGNNGQALPNKNISFRFTIRELSSSGNISYQEIQNTTTSQVGSVSIKIGSGQSQSGQFSDVRWGIGSHYLQIELDDDGGTAFADMGTVMLVSVPYSLYSKSASFADSVASYHETDPLFEVSVAKGITAADTAKWNASIFNESDPVFRESVAGSISSSDTARWNDAVTESQTLEISSDTLSISDGNYVILPKNYQNLSINDDTLRITNGDFVTLPKQELAIVGDTLKISGSNYVLLPSGNTQNLTLKGDTLSISGGNEVILNQGEARTLTPLLLTGTVTDQEAIDLIDSIGIENIKYVYVRNTSQLTTLDLTGLKEAVIIIIERNPSLAELLMPDLEVVSERLNISQSPLSVLDVENLSIILGNVFNINGTNLSSITFPQNVFASHGLNFTVNTSGSVNLQDVYGYVTINGGGLEIVNGELSLLNDVVVTAGNISESLHVSYASSVSWISADVCNFNNVDTIEPGNVAKRINISGKVSKQADLSSFNGSAIVVDGTSLTSANLTSMTEGRVIIINNNLLMDLDLFNYTGSSEVSELSVYGNASLSSINFSSLQKSGITLYNMHSNAFNEETLNSLLNIFASIDPPLSGVTIDLNNQTTGAQPSGQGLIDIATLEANGNTVAY